MAAVILDKKNNDPHPWMYIFGRMGGWCNRPIVLSAICALVFTAVMFHVGIQPRRGYLQDDAYFYAQTAYNIAATGISTFDGLNVTDGYHILWCRMLALVSKVLMWFTPAKPVHLFAYLVLSAFILFYTAIRFGKNLGERLLFFGLGYLGSLMMETQLLALFFLLFCEAARPGRERSIPWFWAFFIPLTRIDAAIMPMMVAAALLRTSWRRSLLIVMALLAGAATHFMLQWSIDGYWFSVSSTIKAQAHSVRLLDNLWFYGRATMPRSFILMMLAAVSAGMVGANIRLREALFPLGVWLGAAAFSFGHLTFSYMSPWYFVPGHVAFAWLIFELGRKAEGRILKMLPRAVLWVLLTYIYLFYFAAQVHRYFTAAQESRTVWKFIEQISRLVPEGERVYQIDGSGTTGFWSDRSIVNGDGLVNSHAYAGYRREGRVDEYLAEQGIRHVITFNLPTGGRALDFAGLKMQESAVLVEYFGSTGSRAYCLGLYRLPTDDRFLSQ